MMDTDKDDEKDADMDDESNTDKDDEDDHDTDHQGGRDDDDLHMEMEAEVSWSQGEIEAEFDTRDSAKYLAATASLLAAVLF